MAEASLSIRRAALSDAATLFRWRNDPLTRKNSLSESELDWDSHMSWLEKTLAAPDRKLFVLAEGDEPVGTVRFDVEGEQEGRLSWTVAPEARGRGLGKQMVRLACSVIPGGIRAEIKLDNVASQKIAEHAGLSLDRTESGIQHWRRKT